MVKLNRRSVSGDGREERSFSNRGITKIKVETPESVHFGKDENFGLLERKERDGWWVGVKSRRGQVGARSWRTVKAIREFIQLGNREPWEVFEQGHDIFSTVL